ncbi:cyanophycinase [Flavobacterium defluvii]|uniref:Cyanophycinase n=1 Tax=Flavobacterium defluvii TaxID=370979 RepID=A0A1M5VRT6_9FLAO|nr:cyanophycinase [Flavobacterium defluvii]SHH77937.1 Cyanophycinase [Flavobacterium defluvii]
MKILAITFLFILSACSSENNSENPVPQNPEVKNYQSYFTGNKVDKITTPQGGICLMGGAAENDEAMKWFLKRADGGDVLVLRTSGSDGYNSYLFNSLGVAVNSVETIVFKNAKANSDKYILEKINNAEAIWFAGGDQWEYILYWRNTPISEAINNAITNKKVVVGGTSAGMAIQGSFYFSAQNGTITSQEALLNPFDTKITISKDPFLDNVILKDVITDTHYDNPDRKGRHVTFLARIINDYKIQAKGIACEEYTAVCIDEKGIARVFGSYPSKEDAAYFIMPNDEIADNKPEVCKPNNPLQWNQNQAAINVYEVKGTNAGTNTFNLNNWNEGKGGIWKKWFVENGKLKE